MPSVRLERDAPVTKLTMDRPPNNAIDSDALGELRDHFRDLAADKETRVIILTGSNFLIGADVEELDKATPEEAARLSRPRQEIVKFIRSIEKLVTAVVRGFVFGGALELVAACDIIIAAEDGELAASETGLAAIPGWGGTQPLPRHVRERKARSMIITGRALTAQRAREIGPVYVIVPLHFLEREVEEIVTFLPSRAPLAVAAAKRAIMEAFDKPLRDGLEIHEFSALFATRDEEEGMRVFLEERAAV